MRILNLKYIFIRIWKLIISPAEEWRIIDFDKPNPHKLFKGVYIPFALILSILVLPVSLSQFTIGYAIIFAIINFFFSTIGAYLAFLLIREYISNKIKNAEKLTLEITIYCSIIFNLFYSLSGAVGNSFLSQLLGLFSIIFLRTLYIGIQRISELTENQKTNLFIIAGLSIAFIPMIIKQLLLIIFEVPLYNL